MLRSNKPVRFAAVLLALTGASAFAIECTKYLHSNLVSVDAVLEKTENANAWIDMIAGDEPGKFYVTDQKAFGIIEERSGKFQKIYEAEKNAMIFEIQNNAEYVTGIEFMQDGNFRTGQKRNRAARDAAQTATKNADGNQAYPGSLRQFIYIKKTGKVVHSAPIPNGGASDWQWARQGADYFPSVSGDKLSILDLHTLETKKIVLDDVPNRIAALADPKVVMAMTPGKSPVLVDAVTGEKIHFPELERLHIGDQKRKGVFYIQGIGNKFYFSTDLKYSDNGGILQRGKLFEVDAKAHTIRPCRDVPQDFIPDTSYSDGRLLMSRHNKPSPPSGVTGEDLEKWNRAHAKDAPTKTALFDTLTHREIVPAAPLVLATEGGPTTAIIRFADGANEKDAAYFYTAKRGLQPVKDPNGGRINLFLFDPANRRWIAHADTPGKQPSTSYAIVFDLEGKYVDRIDVSQNLVSGDSRGRFIGLVSSRWYQGHSYIRLDVPKIDYQAATPTGGWAKAAPQLSKFMTEAQARKEYPHLIDFFEGKQYAKHPESAAGIFANLFAISNNYGSVVLREHPELLDLFKKYPVRPQDYTKAEYAAQAHAVRAFLTVLHTGAQFTDAGTAYFHALRPFLKLTPEKQVEDIVDGIADTYQNLVMAEDAEVRSLFTSKVYKLVRHSFSEDFPLKEGPLTDLTYTQADQKLTLLAVGTHGVEDGVQTRYGLSYKVMEKIDVPADVKPNTTLVEKDFAWVHNGERFTAKAIAKVSDRTLAEIVKFEDAPDYAALLKDKKLTTMVITGSNLIEDSSTVLSEYLQAFRNRGYHFDEDVEVPNLLEFLKEKISKGEIDLFDKEAHSDGDEKNLFRIFRKGRYKIGRKKMPNGHEEVVYLVFPPKNAGTSDALTTLISNDDFGDWMRAREKIGVPFYYLNSSCWSATKAGAEITAAHSPMLREMASLTTMDEFTADLGSTMWETIFGFLDQKSWDEIQAASLKDPSTKGGDNNILLFPSNSGKEAFMKNVLAGFKQPIDVKIQVFDKDGKPYIFDEQP